MKVCISSVPAKEIHTAFAEGAEAAGEKGFPQALHPIPVPKIHKTVFVQVAQDDAVPRRWAYPTTWWEADEVVSDEMILSLSDVPSGRYRLAVGVYDAESGERLAVMDAAGGELSGRRLVLAEEIAR